MYYTELKKPPIDFKRQLLKWGITLPLLALSCFLLIISYKNIVKYSEAKLRAVELQATITEVEYRYDSENGDDYFMYVTYSYEGREYRKFWKASSTNCEDRIGEQVSVVVDSENPDKYLSDFDSIVFFSGFLAHPLLAIACYTAFLNGRKTYEQWYGSRPEALEADRCSTARRRVFWLSCFVYAVSLTIHGIFSVRMGGVFSTEFLFSFAALVGGVVLLIIYRKNCKRLCQ